MRFSAYPKVRLFPADVQGGGATPSNGEGIGDQVKIIVDGEFITLSRDEAIRRLSLESGAQKRMQEAAAIRKKYEGRDDDLERLDRWKSYIERMKGGGIDGIDAGEALSREMGLSTEGYTYLRQQLQQQQEGGTMQDSEGGGTQYAKPASLPPEAQAALQDVTTFLAQMRKRGLDPATFFDTFDRTSKGVKILGDTQTADYFRKKVTNNPTLRAMVERDPEILDEIWAKFRRRVDERGEPLTDATIEQAVKDFTRIIDVADSVRLPNRQTSVFGGIVPPALSSIGGTAPPAEPKIEDFKGDQAAYIDAMLAYTRSGPQ